MQRDAYPAHVCRYLESKRARVRSPADLLRESARALIGRGDDAYVYEERFIHAHYPTRLCPRCDDVVQMEVVVDANRECRWRSCPACGRLEADDHVQSELHEMLRTYRRFGGGVDV